jgi:hypothetical protein
MAERRLGVSFCVTSVLLTVLLAYPLSAGPVSWLWFRGFLPERLPVYRMYAPLFAASARVERVRDAYRWYVGCGVPGDNPMIELMFLKARLEWHERYPRLFPCDDFLCGGPCFGE